jgi:hypothetical protein
MNAMGMQMGSTMSMGSTGSTETESSLESSCSKDSASTSSSLSTSSCEPASTVSYGSAATGAASGSVASKTTDTSTATYATPRKDVARTSPIASTDLSTAITQELQRRAQQVRSIDVEDKIDHGSSSVIRSPEQFESEMLFSTHVPINAFLSCVLSRISQSRHLLFFLSSNVLVNFFFSMVILQ